MSICPECNKTMRLLHIRVTGLCPSCADKRIKHQAERIKELKGALAFTNSMILSGENHSDKSKKAVEQALKGGE